MLRLPCRPYNEVPHSNLPLQYCDFQLQSSAPFPEHEDLLWQKHTSDRQDLPPRIHLDLPALYAATYVHSPSRGVIAVHASTSLRSPTTFSSDFRCSVSTRVDSGLGRETPCFASIWARRAVTILCLSRAKRTIFVDYSHY